MTAPRHRQGRDECKFLSGPPTLSVGFAFKGIPASKQSRTTSLPKRAGGGAVALKDGSSALSSAAPRQVVLQNGLIDGMPGLSGL